MTKKVMKHAVAEIPIFIERQRCHKKRDKSKDMLKNHTSVLDRQKKNKMSE